MSEIKLPPEIISLAHHVELNKAGWWDKAIQRFIIGAIWLSNKPTTIDIVSENLKSMFQVNVDSQRLTTNIKRLCDSGDLLSIGNRQFKISERALRQLDKDLHEYEETAEKAKGKFIEVLASCCPSLSGDETWSLFNEKLLVPMVREMGARIYELISGVTMNIATSLRFQSFLKTFTPHLQQSLRNAVVTFLDPKIAYVRSYILHCMTIYFFVEASSLRSQTLDALRKLTNMKPTFTVFLDTNFLFSILGLHENPSNDAALSLMNLFKQLSGQVSVKVYVVPPTVEEAKRASAANRIELERVRLTTNLIDATLMMDLSGIQRKFFEEAKKSPFPLEAKSYFDPYLQDLTTILRAKGVELFNEKLDRYKTDQSVIDDIASQVEYESTQTANGAKKYSKWDHDVVLWHFTKDKRSACIESPLESRYWIVTVDYGFLAFDKYRRGQSSEKMPVCVHPTQLIQMLQFWVPRTAQFEEAMLNTMRLPFLFHEFDPNAEKVTLSILQTLSRFDNVGDLSRETTTAILVNEILRQKLVAEPDVEKQVALVHDALVEQQGKTEERLRESTQLAASLEKETKEKDARIKNLNELLVHRETKVQYTEQALEGERKARRQLEKEIGQIGAELKTEKEKQETKIHRRHYVTKSAIELVSSAGIFALGTSALISYYASWGFGKTASAVCSLSLILWLWLVDIQGMREPYVKDWKPFGMVHKFKLWLFLLLFAITANAVWDWIKWRINQ
jgi:hypothetical protein